MHIVLGIVLGCLANRCWGMSEEKVGPFTIGTRWQYIFLTILACFIARPQLVTELHGFMFLLIGALAYGVRFLGTGQGWLAYETGSNRMLALTRGWPYLILAVVLTMIDDQDGRMFMGFAFPICAAFYYYAGKYRPLIATEIAELLVGGYMVAIASICWKMKGV